MKKEKSISEFMYELQDNQIWREVVQIIEKYGWGDLSEEGLQAYRSYNKENLKRERYVDDVEVCEKVPILWPDL